MRDITARRLVMGVLAAALTALWAIVLVKFDPNAQLFHATAPSLAVTLGLGFAGVALLIGVAPGRADL